MSDDATPAPRPEFWLLVDVGNTFLKWGLCLPPDNGDARSNRVESGHALLEEIPSLAPQFARFPTPARIVISNVAGTRARSTVIRALEVWPDAPPPHWVIPREVQCGVVNRYRNPAQLGSDRWAALIGARHRVGERDALVVVCGTATTADFLTAGGEFKGGVIFPGVGLMLRALHEKTAALPDADGVYTEYPTQTVDAIVTGCLHAQAGAVERLYHRHGTDAPRLVCLLSGGAARALAPRLTIPFDYCENIVLEGLYRICKALA